MSMLEKLAYKISAWNRKRKWDLFNKEIAPKNSDTILDVGFTNTEYSDTDNYLEKNYSFKNKITALGVGDSYVDFSKRYPEVEVILYDGGIFPFDDKHFDIVWSNAVIEHVGNRKKQITFLKELHRVGKKVFFTTPNKFFPVEVHTRIPLLHILLGKKQFDWFLKIINKKWARGDYMNLSSKKDLVGMLESCDVKKYSIIKNRFFGFVIDFVVIINN